MSLEQNLLCENYIEEENGDDILQESCVSNGDFYVDVNEEELDIVYENIVLFRKEKIFENFVKIVNEEYDVVVLMWRRVFSKRIIFVDMYVLQVVEEVEEEDDEYVDDVIFVIEGQEEMLMNLIFEFIEELFFKGKEM